MSVLKRSLVLLYSFKQSHQSSFAHIANVFFFLFCVAELIRDG